MNIPAGLKKLDEIQKFNDEHPSRPVHVVGLYELRDILLAMQEPSESVTGDERILLSHLSKIEERLSRLDKQMALVDLAFATLKPSPEVKECKSSDKVCPYCLGDTTIRNPTGNCDHLYYPENVNKNYEVKEKVECVCKYCQQTREISGNSATIQISRKVAENWLKEDGREPYINMYTEIRRALNESKGEQDVQIF